MCILGLDIGSSGCKATIVDSDGEVVAQAGRLYATCSPQPGYYEMDPNEVWQSVQRVIVDVLAQHHKSPITAIGISSFGEAVVPLDCNGEVLANSLTYMDARGGQEANKLADLLGAERIYHLTGCSVHPMHSICKIMWMKEHDPAMFSRVWKFLSFSDYILFKLGAEACTDYSLAARTMAFDITNKCWSEEILEAAGLNAGLFGQPVQSGTLVGTIEAGIAAQLGLPSQVLLVAGGHDQTCAALGAGVIGSGIAVDGLGTTECITPVFDHPILTKEMAESSYACVPHVLPNKYVTYGFTFSSGSLLTWYLDHWGQSITEEAARTSSNRYERFIQLASADPSPLFVLPHWAGAATPYMDVEATGAIIGLNLASTAADIMKAILEGITFEMMVNVERMEHLGIAIHELRAVGGLANSDAYLQLKADMMGKVVSSLHIGEAGTLGVAILAGKAAGLFHTHEEAVNRLVKVKQAFYPDAARRQFYLERFNQYKKLYPALKGLRG
ncbi:L-fuculokinase [Paenibacillus sp. GCM10023252]|uniref:FGGY-family carbohydrate kinase n=1 Tax=Paenibacillus sp. GCM10023252 TaxID=3252649 RepID=UPI0036143222